ncbi:hypothetical protein Tco_1280991 [Tanacetum coccineum]
MSARISEEATLSPYYFSKRYRSSYETSSSSSPPALPIQKRYRGTLELVEDTKDKSSDSGNKREGSEGEGYSSEDKGPVLEDAGHGLEDDGPNTKEKEVAPEGQQQALLVVDNTMDEPLGLSYEELRCHELVLGEGLVPIAPVQTPPSPEWLSGSLPFSLSSPTVPSPIASLVTTLAATISVDEDPFLEVGAQLELYRSILHDHTQRLDALPPTLFEGYDRDLRELYTRSGAVRDEIFSQRYRFKSLEQDQERTIVTFSAIWRPRENYDLRMQIAKERRERLELTNRVARIERRQESRRE